MLFRGETLNLENLKTDSEMAGRHRCRPRSIQIIRTGIVAAKDTKRPDVQQFHVSCWKWRHFFTGMMLALNGPICSFEVRL